MESNPYFEVSFFVFGLADVLPNWNEVGVWRGPVGECQGMSVRCVQDFE